MTTRYLILIVSFLCLNFSSVKAQDYLCDIDNFRYDIYYESRYGTNLIDSLGSFMKVGYRKESKQLLCTYHISKDKEYCYNVTDLQIRADSRMYTLEKFFQNKYDAILKIIDVREADNMKVAIIYYRHPNEEHSDTVVQLVMFSRL